MRLADDPNYTRLPGGSRSLLRPVQYWLARDHVLLVEVVWLVEKYRRFDLKDLEALTVRPTWARASILVGLMFLMVPLLGLGGYLWIQESDRASRAIAGALVGLAVAIVAYAGRILSFGPGCEVRLTTSVQSIVLPGLRFRKSAERFRAALLAALAGLPPASSGGSGGVVPVAAAGKGFESAMENPALES